MNSKYRMTTFVVCFVYSCRILVGNNILNMYSSMIYSLSGIRPKVSCFIQAAANLAGCFFIIYLSRNVGRRLLLITGYFSATVIHVIVIISSHLHLTMLITIATALFSFVFNAAISVSLVYAHDIGFEAALSVGSASISVSMLLNSFITPYMLMNPDVGVTGTFITLAAVATSGLVFSLFVLKETKGLTDDECKSLYHPK